MESFLFQASIFLAAAVIAVPLAARLGLGSVLGYLAAGILIGPVFGLVGGHETEELQHFAEFGVVMMLFLIGLELEPRALWDMRHRLLGLGGLQIVLTTLAVMAGAMTARVVRTICSPPSPSRRWRMSHSARGSSSSPMRNSIITTPNSAKCCNSSVSWPPTRPKTGP